MAEPATGENAQSSDAVGVTADGLVVLRAGAEAAAAGIRDPHAALFVTEEGRRLAALAAAVDGVYAPYNLARFRHTTDHLRRSGVFAQILVAGAGFDTRPLWIPELADVRVFEVDQPTKLEQKRSALLRAGTAPAENVTPVAADLSADELPEMLVARGFRRGAATLLLAEGVSFYLPAAVTRRILDPAWLGLGAGSSLLFDFWSDERVDSLNALVRPRLGFDLFRRFPFAGDPAAGLRTLGWTDIRVLPLEEIAGRVFGRAIPDAFGRSWFLVEARGG